MILTAAFIIAKAIGASWSWWYIGFAIAADMLMKDDKD